MPPDFPLKTTPYKHQREALDRSADAEFYALFMEQRTGKTKVALDTVAYNHLVTKRVDALLVMAPNGVHVNWVREEIPVHLSDECRAGCVIWRSGRMQTKAMLAKLEALLAYDGLSVLSVNIDALLTKQLRAYLPKLLKRRRVMAVVDESLDISTPGAERTKVALKIGARAAMRRILDGTPGAATPMGLFSQVQFLKPGALGFTSYLAFKQRYATWEARDVGERNRVRPDCAGNERDPPCSRCGGYGYVGKHTFQQLKEYQNLDELTSKLSEFSFRVRRDECADLPPKIYTKRFFELSTAQRRAYEDLRETYMTELSGGDTVTAAMVLTRYLRLQQLSSNFLPVQDDARLCEACQGEGCAVCDDVGFIAGEQREVEVDDSKNPRLDAFRAMLETTPGQGIVWSRFKRDQTILSEACDVLGVSYVRFDGGVSQETREINKRAFQDGNARLLLGNQRAGGRGHDLSAADWVCYYSHDWSLRWRLQSEDRAQSLKRRDSVLYIDLVAEGTVDEKIIDALRSNRRLSDLIAGDPQGDWI